MAQKTLINGTAYKVKNGKTLINGTAYKVKNGKTLVGGTAYKIEFYVPTYTITITRASSHGQVWINGVQYNYITTITVPQGTEVNFLVTGDSSRRVNLNGTKVSTDISSNESLYVHTMVSNISVECNEHSFLGGTWGVITITEV